LKAIERNVYRHYFQDGLFDMLAGAYFLLIGLGLLAGTVAPFVALPIVFFAPALQALKKRFTIPRTGYVKLREGDPQPLPWFILGSLGLGLAALVIVLVARGVIAQPARWYRWMPIFFGIWLGGTLLGLGVRVGVVRYYVAGNVALVAGPVSTLVATTEKLGNLGLCLAVVGGVWLGGGIVTFVRFLRKYPVQAEEAGDANA
jgi:hypothetical protein